MIARGSEPPNHLDSGGVTGLACVLAVLEG